MKIRYINRELSWLAFNDRVLQEAMDENNPLIERMRFLGIFSNNLDEFFRVRVATLKRLSALKKKELKPLSLDDPDVILEAIYAKVITLNAKFRKTFLQLKEDLKSQNVFWLDEHQVNKDQALFLNAFYTEKIRPFLVPIILKDGVFPSLNDEEVYFAVSITDDAGEIHYALIELPENVERLVVLPSSGKKRNIMFLDDVIRYHLKSIFPIYKVAQIEAHAFKITRDSELDLDDDLTTSMYEKIAKSLEGRKKGRYVRFVFDQTMPEALSAKIIKELKVKKDAIYPSIDRYHNKKDLMSFPGLGKPELQFEPYQPKKNAFLDHAQLILPVLDKQDVMLHYPYQSFDHTIDILREAAIDPEVQKIYINLYRVAKDSRVINSLVNASRNGKEVIAVLELRARFDEENNLKWSTELREQGIEVYFGVSGLKVHSKLIYIEKNIGGEIRRYAHIGTGNFHERTAKVYGDLSLWTAHKGITKEVGEIFNFFKRNYEIPNLKHLLMSPFNTRSRYIELIKQEKENALNGKKAAIFLKVNNLLDKELIDALYEASEAGVKIKIVARGICALIPGNAVFSKNIEVISIVGRFLEHVRAVRFYNAGEPLYYISSADWMNRNLSNRVEVSVPIYDAGLQKEIDAYFDVQWKDSQKSRVLNATQSNPYRFKNKGKVNSQEFMMRKFNGLKD